MKASAQNPFTTIAGCIQRSFARVIVTLTVLMLAQLTFANTAFERFAQQPERPSMAELLGAVKNGTLELKSPTDVVRNLNAVMQVKRVARIIAAFEKAYPGLTYAFLGRDSAFLADAVEAFYLSRGEIGRVVRLNASGDSIYGTKPELLMLFLRQSGFHPTAHGLERPYIIIDRTSYGSGSQSRRLLHAGYTGLLAAGVDPKVAMRQFAAVNLGESGETVSHDLEENFFSKLKLTEGKDPAPEKLLSIPGKDLIDRSFWHDSYGAFEVNESGVLRARAGKAFSIEKRKEVLQEILDIMAVVRTPAFEKAVESYALFENAHLLSLGDRMAKAILPSEAALIGLSAKSGERLAALEFLSSFDGRIETHWAVAETIRIDDPGLKNVKERLIKEIGEVKEAREFLLAAVRYVASVDILVGLFRDRQEQGESKKLVERAFAQLEKTADQLVLMLSLTKLTGDHPRLPELIAEVLQGGKGPAWDSLRSALETRWQTAFADEIQGLEKPTAEAKTESLKKEVAKVKRRSLKDFVLSWMFPNGLLGSSQGPTSDRLPLQFESIQTSVGRYIEYLGMKPRGPRCAAVLKSVK